MLPVIAAVAAFYTPSVPLPYAKPGTVIRSEPFAGGSSMRNAARNILVLYHTKNARGEDTAVSGTIAIPRGTPPPGGWPVISWAHGTTGNAPQCAPSRTARENAGQRLMDVFVAHGYAVAQTDYEGNGTPGPHPYFAGAVAMHDVTDIVRAALKIDPSIGKRWISMGHSEGGNAALFAGAQAQAWAPELQLLGTVVYAPGAYVTYAVQTAIQSQVPFRYLPLPVMMVQGMADADPSLSLSALLSPRGLAMLPQLSTRCIDDLMNDPAWTSVVPASLFRKDANFLPLFRDLNANDSILLKLTVPALVLQGTADEIVAAGGTRQLVGALCANGSQHVTYLQYPGANHGTVMTVSLRDAQRWVAARFAGDAPGPGNCPAI